MTGPLRIRSLEIFPLAIPLRLRFEHAAATRQVADPVVVKLTAEAPHAHCCGYGETLARTYVTGETAETVVDDVRSVFAPLLLGFHGGSLAEAVEFARGLPTLADGRLINAARCAVELALLDLATRVYRRPLSDVVAWLELGQLGSPGSVGEARYSGIVVGQGARLTVALGAQRLFGLRDFKIKVAVAGWQQRLRDAHRVLGRALEEGRATLRADANGAWTYEEALAAGALLRECGVTALEQPLAVGREPRLPDLARELGLHLVADESLLTLEDARELLSDGGVQVFNIRLAKCGGLLPSLEMAARVLAAGRDVQLGCMVGETSILSAAGVSLLEVVPRVRFVEGAFGRWLLREDVVARPVTFGRGGRVPRLDGQGLGIEVDESRLRSLRVRAVAPLRF